MKPSPSVKYATFPQRLLAFNIDMTFFLLTVMPLTLVIEDDWHFMLLLFGSVCLYHAFLESSAWEATLGKKYAGLRVANSNGGRLTFGKALIRIISKHLSLMIFFLGFFMIYFRKDRRGLHDILSGSLVLIAPKKGRKLSNIPN